jgi:deazaflavin-dependent oxidoreductase (nitroreductase family)
MASPANLAERLAQVADRSTLQLTHYGRKTHKPYAVTIWFVTAGDTLYLATMNATRQWVRNVARTPRVQLTIGHLVLDGEVTRISAQRDLLRAYELFVRKYWAMWLLDGIARLLGRNPLTTHKVDTGRGAFFRVELPRV